MTNLQAAEIGTIIALVVLISDLYMVTLRLRNGPLGIYWARLVIVAIAFGCALATSVDGSPFDLLRSASVGLWSSALFLTVAIMVIRMRREP